MGREGANNRRDRFSKFPLRLPHSTPYSLSGSLPLSIPFHKPMSDQPSNSQSIDGRICVNKKTAARILFADLTISPFLCSLSSPLPFLSPPLSLFLLFPLSLLFPLTLLAFFPLSYTLSLSFPRTISLSFPSLSPCRLRRHTHMGRCVGWRGTGRDRAGWIHNFRSDAHDAEITLVAHVQVGQRTALSKGERRERENEKGW